MFTLLCLQKTQPSKIINENKMWWVIVLLPLAKDRIEVYFGCRSLFEAKLDVFSADSCLAYRHESDCKVLPVSQSSKSSKMSDSFFYCLEFLLFPECF